MDWLDSMASVMGSPVSGSISSDESDDDKIGLPRWRKIVGDKIKELIKEQDMNETVMSDLEKMLKDDRKLNAKRYNELEARIWDQARTLDFIVKHAGQHAMNPEPPPEPEKPPSQTPKKTRKRRKSKKKKNQDPTPTYYDGGSVQKPRNRAISPDSE